MTTIGGSRNRTRQKRGIRKDAVTVADRRRFLEVLGETCNATAACAAIGRSYTTMRGQYKRDAEFAALWQQMLDEGYQRLEGELLSRALGQATNGDNPHPDALDPGRGVGGDAVDPALALRLLQMRDALAQRRNAVGAAACAESTDAVLRRKLDALERRLAREGDA